MKDIDPSIRKKTSLKNGIAIKDGYDAFILALQDVIETKPTENPEDPERGTYISIYLKDSVNTFNALVIEDLVKLAITNYLSDYEIQVDEIDVYPDYDNNEYVVSIPVKESDVSEDDRDLTITLQIQR